jgi:hypothetical protein
MDEGSEGAREQESARRSEGATKCLEPPILKFDDLKFSGLT